MEIFRWVKGMMLATVVIISFRICAQRLGYLDAAHWAGYAAVLVVLLGAVLTIIGVIVDRRPLPSQRKEEQV